jgi:hypothetical protein
MAPPRLQALQTQAVAVAVLAGTNSALLVGQGL